MLNNQNSKIADTSPLVGQDVSQLPTTDLDSQTIDEILGQLDEEETKQKNTGAQNTIGFLAKKIKPTTTEESSLTDKEIEKQKPLKKVTQIELEEEPQTKETKTENSKIRFAEIFESVKKAKLEYEKLERKDGEKKIPGTQAVKTYLRWIKKSRNLLRECVSKEEKESVSIFIPERIQKQIEDGTVPPFILNGSDKTSLSVKQTSSSSLSSNETEDEKPAHSDGEESVLDKRVRNIEKRINNLDPDKPEYPEELLPLETKKVLMKEEIENKKNEESVSLDEEKLNQEISTKELINKQSFENKAPVVRPEKEEKGRIKKAQLAEEIEKEKVQEKGEKEEEITPLKITKQEKESIPFYSAEQLDAANEKRVEFHKKLSSITKSNWYKSPSVNRDFVNKQIIQVAAILSSKDSIDIEMNDIQTARIFMFNEAPEEILKHPSFYYVESFYNYQSSQGCLGINPEEIFSKQENPDYKSKNLSTVEKGRFFIEQVSPKKPDNIQKTKPKESTRGNPKEEAEEKVSDVLENVILD